MKKHYVEITILFFLASAGGIDLIHKYPCPCIFINDEGQRRTDELLYPQTLHRIPPHCPEHAQPGDRQRNDPQHHQR